MSALQELIKKAHDTLGELIEWDAMMGHHESPVWVRARRLYALTALPLHLNRFSRIVADDLYARYATRLDSALQTIEHMRPRFRARGYGDQEITQGEELFRELIREPNP